MTQRAASVKVSRVVSRGVEGCRGVEVSRCRGVEGCRACRAGVSRGVEGQAVEGVFAN